MATKSAKNPETVALLNSKTDQIKKSAIIIDIAHDMFDRDKILELITKGDLFGYGFEAEPDEFVNYKGNVWAAPAYAWATKESLYNAMERWTDNMVSAAKNEFPTRINT